MKLNETDTTQALRVFRAISDPFLWIGCSGFLFPLRVFSATFCLRARFSSVGKQTNNNRAPDPHPVQVWKLLHRPPFLLRHQGGGYHLHEGSKLYAGGSKEHFTNKDGGHKSPDTNIDRTRGSTARQRYPDRVQDGRVRGLSRA